MVISTACGSSPAPKPLNLTVTTTDFTYSPDVWEVKPGQKINFTLVNNGTLKHEWVLFKQGQVISPPFNDDDEDKIHWEIEAEAGKTNSGEFVAPEAPGEYEVVCGVAGHYEAGMHGKFIVK